MAKEKICGIYKIENLIGNKIYVGQSRNIKDRFKNHKGELRLGKHHNSYLQFAWNKYGEENFRFEILEICSIELLDFCEIKWISELNTLDNKFGYNLVSGGNLNKILSEEHKRKISKNMPDFNGENNPFFNKKHTPETIKKIKMNLPNHDGENNPSSKLTNSQVAEIKYLLIEGKGCTELGMLYNVSPTSISAINKNKIWKSVDIKEFNEWNLKRNNKQYKNTLRIPIIQLSINGEFIREWSCAFEASDVLNISGITACCRGRQKTCKGFKWMYKKDYEKELID